MTPATVLFVCSGNLYRSPIAERLFAAHLGSGVARFRVGSAGTVAYPGAPLGSRTAEIISELGGRPDRFVTRRLTVDLVASADVVLGLAREHREAAVRLVPTALRRCFVLGEFVRLTGGDRVNGGDRADVGDQTGGEVAALVARAAAERGRWPPAEPGADDVADPEGRPDEFLRTCAVRIDHAAELAAAALTGAVRAAG